ncbi:hypothetical protein BDZ91DRAFT_821228, partial [Kalaharituber pfeilii]
TADWWVEKQRLLSPNVTVVPILLASDQTHLTNFSGDKKLWPVYMSIGNIVSRPSAHAWVPIALLPVNPKRMSGISGWTKKDQGVDSLQVFHDIMRTVLRPLVHLYEAGGVEMLCADEKVRKCVPILCTWHADYMENINIHGIKLNLCPMCTVPKEALGTLPKTAYSQRDHLRYQQYLRSKNTALLDKHGMKPISNALWSLPTVSHKRL